MLLEGEVCAFAYHAGKSRYRPQMQGLLAQTDHDVDTLDVCVYLLRDAEMGNFSSLCYQHGETLESSDDEIDNAAIEAFRQRCTRYGVDLRKAPELLRAIDGQVANELPDGWPQTLGQLEEVIQGSTSRFRELICPGKSIRN